MRIGSANRLGELLAEFPGGDAAAFADHLVARGALTPFQAARALAGGAAGLVLGPYRLTGVAGPGTFGPMFAASHATRPGEFAVRTLPLRSLWRARQAKQLARSLGSAPAHPAVSSLAEVDSANGFHYLVWPRDAGERLSERVNAAGPLAPGDAAAVLAHLAAALAACHARGVAHGALTPACVSLAPTGLPRVLDLGAGALLAQNLDADESLLDTMSASYASANVLAFAAPELAESLAPSPAADQYALAAVGYFALTGLAPYPHPTLPEQLRAKRLGPPPSVAVVSPDVPPELAALLERAMSPDPVARFASLGEFEERLAALDFSGPPAPPATPPEMESLLLSRVRTAGGGTSGAVARAARDDPDASVRFDLADADEELPDAGEVAEAAPGSAAVPLGGSLPLPTAGATGAAPCPPAPVQWQPSS
ncbi:MAG: protein kinase domain-containing protein, partial [Gemmata sp.]